MVVWGFVLIAMGAEALFDVTIWPVVLIAIGVSALLSVYCRGNREASMWFNCWQCWPGSYRTEPQDLNGPRRE